jgi:transposase
MRKGQKQNKYTAEFKERAVKLAESSDVPISQVAVELGISKNLLYKWTSKFGKKEDGIRYTPTEHEELKVLRKENHRLREERDILKKAVIFFTKESESGSSL